MSDYSIQGMISLIWQAFRSLGAHVPPKVIEETGILVHKIMNLQSRTFHTPEHVIDLSSPDDPIQTLAAMFHDIVYYQVDRGFPAEIEKLLSDVVTEENHEVRIKQNWDYGNREISAALEIFNFKPGQKLNPYGGLNEFLSAIVTAKICGPYLKTEDLFQIMVCIEATIPFRGPDEAGRTWSEALLIRIEQGGCGLQLSTQTLTECLKRAVRFSNRDVGNFADPDMGAFLDNTWKLLPETNVQLHQKDYTIVDYRQSLEKMERFFMNLKAQSIYKEFKGEPPQEIYASMLAGAQRNVELAKIYLGIKLLSLAIIEALALSSGGDVPINLFLGEIRRPQTSSPRLEDYLPTSTGQVKPKDSVMYHLLISGRNQDIFFDMKNSPLSAYLCEVLEQEAIAALLELAKSMFQGKLNHVDFLKALPPQLCSAVATACATMVPTRADALKNFIN